MILIVGLGNPGKNFQRTRHNIGFRVIDEFQKENNFPDFRSSKKFMAEISEEKFDNKKITLVKPQTFMNDSGKTIKLLTKTYGLKSKTLYIVHDDIDLSLGKIRISKSRGSAGHKGVESIIKEIGTKDFIRLRIGIKPVAYELKPKILNKLVLQKFNKKEEEIIKKVVKKTAEVIGVAINKGLERTMTEFNQ